MKVSPLPALQINTLDLKAAAHVRDLDRSIHEDPDNFMQGCRMVAGKAIEFMPWAEEAPVADLEASRHMAGKLRGFLERNDIAHLEFDEASDDAIYSHDGVNTLIRATRNARSQRVKQGTTYVSRENPEALANRNGLSALKLYLYAKRAKSWQSQSTTKPHTRNGAA